MFTLSRWSKFSRLEPSNPYYAPAVRLDSVVSIRSDGHGLGNRYWQLMEFKGYRIQ